MAKFDSCPHCGGEGVCPRGQCPVRDVARQPAPVTRKMPAAKSVTRPTRSSRKRPATNRELPLQPAGNVLKADVVAWWGKQKENQPLRPRPIPYDHTGTTIDEDGIRITGSLAWIKAVVSHLKGLLRQENLKSRLDVAMQELTDRATGQRMEGSYRLSIQVHEKASYAKRTK